MWRGAFPVVDRQFSNRQKSPSGRSHNREKTKYYVRTYVLGTYTLNFHHKKEFTHSKSPIHSKFPILTLGFFCSLLQLTTTLRGAKMQLLAQLPERLQPSGQTHCSALRLRWYLGIKPLPIPHRVQVTQDRREANLKVHDHGSRIPPLKRTGGTLESQPIPPKSAPVSALCDLHPVRYRPGFEPRYQRICNLAGRPSYKRPSKLSYLNC